MGGVTPITETMSKYILIFPRIVANRKLKKYHPNSVNSQQQQEILQLLTFNYPEYEIWPTGIVTIVDVLIVTKRRGAEPNAAVVLNALLHDYLYTHPDDDVQFL